MVTKLLRCGIGVVCVLMCVPGSVSAQDILGVQNLDKTDLEDPVRTQHQPLGEVWTPGYPLVPCGGYVTIDSKTGAISVPQPACDFNRLLQLADNLIAFFSVYMSVPIAAIVFAFAGFTYITGGANPGKRKSAHDMFMRTVVGLVIVFASYLIVHTITSALFTDDVNDFIEGNFLSE